MTTNRTTSLGSQTPTYDANGALTFDTYHSYTWDSEGHAVTLDTMALTYDALGRMVEENPSGVYTQIAYGPLGNKLALMNGQTLSKAFVALPGGATAVYTSSGLSYYRHSDWLGSSRLDSNSSRSVIYQVAYGPYGEPYDESGTTDRNFTGQNQDTVGDMYDFLYREYHEIQGRWILPDPAGLAAVDPTNPQSWNRYAYVLNNPLRYVDPIGLILTKMCWEDSSTDSGESCGYFDSDVLQNEGFKLQFDEAGAVTGISAPESQVSLVDQSGVQIGSIGPDTQVWLGVEGSVQTVTVSSSPDPGAATSMSGYFSQAVIFSSAVGGPMGPGARAVLGSVYKTLNGLDPEPCGGGTFGFRAREFTLGPVKGGAYVIVTRDSQSGTSVGVLGEAGAGPLSGGYEKSVNLTSGQSDSNVLLFVGEGAGLFASFNSKQIGVGLYGSAGVAGGGAYLNFVPGGTCHQ